ncbi:hypothetical protein GIB67_033279 [Kingdonia uniflora]|uniref:Light-mediated development protein DET1 n=1 Tax=Kingdonia uniflora TaxID=39325 RepID=A0A7J7MPU0_9MAGN|nr:hypothetical protein GIB67_033279 [Kingdonia uniflora]
MKSNITARIFDREIRSRPPGTNVHFARRFYENIVPSYTIYNVDCPDHSFRKFTDDGQYLISFSRNHQDLIVYRPTCLSFCTNNTDSDYLPPKANRFGSFFTQLYSISLASNNEFICKDFFLYVESNRFGLFATQTAPAPAPAIQGVPSIEKITFHLVRMEDGTILDQKVLCNDFVNITHNMGVFLYDDLLAILSLRYQTIHILQIRDSVSPVSQFILSIILQNMGIVDKTKQSDSHVSQDENGIPFLSGIKQRLLSFIYRKIWDEERDHNLVQFLDRHHLLIKLGSVDGGVQRNTDLHRAFLAIYNMETTEIVAFYENSADELYQLFEKFSDHFHTTLRNASYMNFISSHSNNIHALEQLRVIKNKASSFPQFVKKMMASLPFSCQSQSPSPYFDQSLFRFDEKVRYAYLHA